jgi:DNA-directed RNA polymerase specialized sigma24 family protein
MALTVEGPARPAPRTGVSGASFEALLHALHPERERAAERYEAMRQRLRRFFRWRGARWPDELVDETLDRVGRKVAGGEVIRAADVGRYFLGVARNVLREAWQRERQRGPQHDVAALANRLDAGAGAAERQAEARLECLDRCLAELPSETRDLVLRYYRGQGVAKVEDRRVLASQLGVTTGTLRIRLHRLRLRLEACVRKCVGEPGEQETSHPLPPPSSEDGDQ